MALTAEQIQLGFYDNPIDDSCFGVGPMEEELLRFRQRTAIDCMCRYGIPESARVLDVGCGRGEVVKFLDTAGYRVVGLDLCPNRLEATKKKTELNSYITGLVRQLPFADHTFSVITAFEIWEHLDKKGDRFFYEEIWRVLGDNGLLILSTPNSRDSAGMVFSLLEKLTGRNIAPQRADHLNECSYREMHDQFTQKGFDLLVHTGIGIIPGVWYVQKYLPEWFIRWNIEAGKVMPSLAQEQLLVVRKLFKDN